MIAPAAAPIKPPAIAAIRREGLHPYRQPLRCKAVAKKMGKGAPGQGSFLITTTLRFLTLYPSGTNLRKKKVS
jgi:hypothetical protein